MKTQDFRDSSISFQTFGPKNLILNLPQLVLIIGKAKVDLDAKHDCIIFVPCVNCSEKIVKGIREVGLIGEMVHETCSIEKHYSISDL